MKLIYTEQYNVNLGPLARLHPFDGQKFHRVYEGIRGALGAAIVPPTSPLDDEIIEGFVDWLMAQLVKSKRRVLEALEVPYIPILPFSVIDRRVLLPMRWAVAGTIEAARIALRGEACCWNLSGGYHHASPHAAEGFCVYNDVGIAHNQLLRSRELRRGDRILIIDVDAHHGNGNARTFEENGDIFLVDLYNDDIYPTGGASKQRVDVGVPLRSGTSGAEYLQKLETALDKVSGQFKLAFVVAGTDVLAGDPLGKLRLSIEDCARRDELVPARLRDLSTPAVMLAGGGYTQESSRAMIHSILRNAR